MLVFVDVGSTWDDLDLSGTSVPAHPPSLPDETASSSLGDVPMLDLLAASDDLTPNEREAVIDHHMVGRSLRAIGDDMGLSGERVRQLEESGLGKLCDRLHDFA